LGVGAIYLFPVRHFVKLWQQTGDVPLTYLMEPITCDKRTEMLIRRPRGRNLQGREPANGLHQTNRRTFDYGDNRTVFTAFVQAL